MESFPASLVLAGAGKMGGAMLRAWLGRGLPPGAICVIDPEPGETIAKLATDSGFALNPPTTTAPQVLVLAIKPQALDEATPALARLAGPNTLVISILAGKTIANVRARLPQAGAIVRAMPNLPAAVGRGVTASRREEAAPAQRSGLWPNALLAATGAVELSMTSA